MPNINVTITNLPQIKAAFSKAPAQMTKELNLAIRKAVLKIQGQESLDYRSLGIRVITGGLINSIRRGTYFSNLRGEVGPNVTGSQGVGYAIYVHEGTKYMRSRPFLYNAVQDSRNYTEEVFKRAVQNVLDDIGRSV